MHEQPNIAASAERTHRADLASSGGAALLGAGVAALLGPRLQGAGIALSLLLLGGLLHGWGMVERRRLERASGLVRRWWWNALWWACWLGLAALGAFILLRQK